MNLAVLRLFDRRFMTTDMNKKRKTIDQIDRRILFWLQKRTKAVDSIAKLKKKNQWPIKDPQRERQILEALVSQNKGPLSPSEIEEIFKLLFKIYRRRQKTKKP